MEKYMVMKLNKDYFINKLSKELSCSLDRSSLINEILERNFFIRKKNKDKVIDELMYSLNIQSEEATKIYNLAIKIITEEVKYKLRHPFKSYK